MSIKGNFGFGLVYGRYVQLRASPALDLASCSSGGWYGYDQQPDSTDNDMKWTLRLTFENQWGDSYTMAVDVDQSIAREIQCIDPPPRDDIEKLVRPMSFEQVCDVLKRKQYRKDLFIGETKRLGALLAERMEDAEGWHDESRIEPAINELRGKRA